MSLRRTVLVLVLIAALAAGLAFTISLRFAVHGIDRDLDQSLILTKRALSTEIARFGALPEVAAEDARVVLAAKRPFDQNAVLAANLYLERVAALSGASQLFLLDRRGHTIAASNWVSEDSFIGNDYSFRPYFTGAVKDGFGRFFGIGVTTGQPGYFLSHRVVVGQSSSERAVIVVKIDLGPLQQAWRNAGLSAAVLDRENFVFLSGDPNWLYRPLSPLSENAVARLSASRAYAGIDLAAAASILADPLRRNPDPDTMVGLRLETASGAALRGGLVDAGRDGWAVMSAAPMAPAYAISTLWAIGAALMSMAGTGSGLILRQRQMLIRLRLRQGALLERRVEERTLELHREIEARRETEIELRATQQNLIHVEKMAALGRMSAAIVHEVSQPLAAMEATLAAAEMSMQRDPDGAMDRLIRARSLITRMQRTIKHLKSFARRDTDADDAASPENTGSPCGPDGAAETDTREPLAVDLQGAIQSTLDLVAPRSHTAGFAPVIIPSTAPITVQAGAVRLEQVCLNMLLNAYDAIDERIKQEPNHRGAISIKMSQQGTGAKSVAVVEIKDNGMGIHPKDLDRVSEPFFSTKTDNAGMGLGLAISQTILLEFGGDMQLASTRGKGTTVSIRLPVAQTKPRADRPAAAHRRGGHR